MTNESHHRQEIAGFGRMLYERGLIAATEGNLSVRLENGDVLATPTTTCKGMTRPEDMVVVSLHGHHLRGEKKVSSEIGMHLAIYRLRSDVHAVVHAHPPTATGFAAAGLALDEPLVAEMVACLGEVPLAPFGLPGTAELARSIEQFIPRHKAILLANHGSGVAQREFSLGASLTSNA